MDPTLEEPPLDARVDGDSRPPGVIRRWLRGWRFFLTFVACFFFAMLPLWPIKIVVIIFGGDPDKGAAYDTLSQIYFFTGFPLSFRAALHYMDIHVLPSR